MKPVSKRLSLPNAGIAPPHLEFRRWERSDVGDLVAAWADPDMHRWIPEEANPFTAVDARHYIAAAGRHLQNGSALPIAVADATTRTIVGGVTFTVWAPHHWNIGYWIDRKRRGEGIATLVVGTLSRWAFTAHPGVERLSLYHLPGNTPSQRVADKSGFQYEGTLRSWAFVAGEARDWHMYSLIRLAPVQAEAYSVAHPRRWAPTSSR